MIGSLLIAYGVEPMLQKKSSRLAGNESKAFVENNTKQASTH